MGDNTGEQKEDLGKVLKGLGAQTKSQDGEPFIVFAA